LRASVASVASSAIAGALACVDSVRVEAAALTDTVGALAVVGAIGVLAVGVTQEPAVVARSVAVGAKKEAERRVDTLAAGEMADAIARADRARAAVTVVGEEREARMVAVSYSPSMESQVKVYEELSLPAASAKQNPKVWSPVKPVVERETGEVIVSVSKIVPVAPALLVAPAQ